MKTRPIHARCALLLAGLTLAGSVWADRGHERRHDRRHEQPRVRTHVGIYIDPFRVHWGYRPYSYPYGYRYYPPPPMPVVVVPPPTPPVYIEQAPVESVWYYCPDQGGYYPYVKACPGGWQTVPAQPPSQP